MMKHFGGSGRPAKRHDLARNFPIAHNSLASFVAITINSGGNRTLKSCATAILLSCLMPALANPAHAADAKANPADYPLAIHVSASTYATPANTLNEIVTATIDGKHYQLQGPASGARIFT